MKNCGPNKLWLACWLLITLPIFCLATNPLPPYQIEIDFPEDAGAECGASCIPSLDFSATGCAVLTVNRDTIRFSSRADECYKLAITIDIIDWCLWDGVYGGATIKRRTEDSDEVLGINQTVERSERPVLRLSGPDSSRLTVVLDRRHNDQRDSSCGGEDDGSSLPDNDTDYDTDDNVSYQGDLLAGRWRYTQFIKVYDNEPPVITVNPYGGPTEACPQLEARQFADVFGSCEASVNLSFDVTDVCDMLDGFLTELELESAEVDRFAVDANEDGDIKVNEFVADEDVTAALVNSAPGAYSFSAVYPIIAPDQPNTYHTLRVVFADGCGNRTSAYLPFQVLDCKGPAPSCIDNITVTLMPLAEPQDVNNDGLIDHCAMDIGALHFAASPVYDCTGQGPATQADNELLKGVKHYTIYRQATIDDTPNFVPDTSRRVLTLTDNDDETTFVRIYTHDEAGNYGYCSTFVAVERHETCRTVMGESISGRVGTADETGVPGVLMSISGALVDSTRTNVEGEYQMFGMEIGEDYTISPSLLEGVDNGVSTFDIVLISKHILGTAPLDSPYKIIAADVNRSGSVTTLDIIQIRKLILRVETSFAQNTSWRFVPSSYVFPDPTNPWAEPFPELINYNDLSPGQEIDLDFIGIKVGDVDLSAEF